MELYFFLLTIITSVAGAISGIGGGVLIKPVLDLTGSMSAPAVNFLSSATVFSMAVVSLGKSFKEHQKPDFRESTVLAAGSILGGLLGKSVFQLLITSHSESGVKFLQSSLLLLVTLIVLVYFSLHLDTYSRSIKAWPFIAAAGLLLGLISVFLGIGGGPLNLAMLSFFFSMPQRKAALNSIYIIFFSQLSSFAACAVQGSCPSVPAAILFLMISGGMTGGYLGTIIRIRMTDNTSEKLFKIILILILFMNLYNVFHFFSLSTNP